MRVLVLNGSPTGENSITLQTVLLIREYCKKAEFEILHVGQKIRSFENDFSEASSALARADLILFCYPVYTFLVPAQLHRFIELIKEHGVDVQGKYATQLTTSKHFYDSTAHQFIQDNCDDLGLRYIRGLSADMEDLLSKKGQKEALSFFRYVLWNMKHGFYEAVRYPRCTGAESFCAAGKEFSAEQDSKIISQSSQEDEQSGQQDANFSHTTSGKIAIVADIQEGEESEALRDMISRFEERSRIACEVFNIREFPFRGGCLGCFHCAADGTCIYKDGFDSWLRESIQSADAIVYAYRICGHSMGSRFKMFDDRQFCNGHRTVTMGKPVGYLVDGHLRDEDNLRTVMEARAQVGGNFLAGIACSESEPDRQIDMLAQTLEYAVKNRYSQPKNFYGVGGLKIFRDLIYQMQGLMKEDHRFYKEHGFYDFPQKRKGTIAFMYLAGAMMSNKTLQKKMGGKMTEGMLMPYKKVLKDHRKRLDRNHDQ